MHTTTAIKESFMTWSQDQLRSLGSQYIQEHEGNTDCNSGSTTVRAILSCVHIVKGLQGHGFTSEHKQDFLLVCVQLTPCSKCTKSVV